MMSQLLDMQLHATNVYFDGHYLGDLYHRGLHTFDDLDIRYCGRIIRWFGEHIMHWWTVILLTIFTDEDAAPNFRWADLMRKDGYLTLIFEDGRRMHGPARMISYRASPIMADWLIVALLAEPQLDQVSEGGS